MRARLAGLVAAAVLGVFASGCQKAAPPMGPNGPVTILRYASPYPPTHPFSQADIAWMKHVEQVSGGRLKIEPYWGGTLVSSDSAVMEVAHDVADIALITPIYSRSGMQAIKVQAGFYGGVRSVAEQVAVYACLDRRYPELTRELHGVRVLAVQGGNLPNILTRGRPVARLEDFKGLRLRTPSEVAPLLRKLGADPVTMPMAEVYSALSKGVVDGVVAPADTLKSLHFSEVAPYLSAFQVPRGAYPARAISDKAWARLSPELQKVLSDAQPFWEQQLSDKVTQAEVDGLAFGHKHGQQFIDPGAQEQARFEQQYDAMSLENAKILSEVGVDGQAMFRDAQASIAAIRAGKPAC